jgi:hypothetical protein
VIGGRVQARGLVAIRERAEVTNGKEGEASNQKAITLWRRSDCDKTGSSNSFNMPKCAIPATLHSAKKCALTFSVRTKPNHLQL